VIAGCDYNLCSGKINTFAELLKLTKEGLFVKILTGIDRKNLACALYKGDLIKVPDSEQHADHAYAVLLTAFSSNSDVIFELDSAKNQCELGSVELLPAK
jgi:hypothetical protein